VAPSLLTRNGADLHAGQAALNRSSRGLRFSTACGFIATIIRRWSSRLPIAI